MKNIRELVLILLSAGILMLVMGSAGESAKRTRCMGNLKKLYGMTLSYENDHGGPRSRSGSSGVTACAPIPRISLTSAVPRTNATNICSNRKALCSARLSKVRRVTG